MKSLFAIMLLIITSIASAQILPNLATAKNYGILSGGTISATDTIKVDSIVGASSAIGSKILASSIQIGTWDVYSALSDLTNAQAALTAQTGTSISGTLDGQSLAPGVYKITGNATLGDTLVLSGDTSAIYIFNITGTLTFNSSAVLSQANGAVRSSKIFWNVQSTTTVNSSAIVSGIILSAGNVSINGPFYGQLNVLSNQNVSLSGVQYYNVQHYTQEGFDIVSYKTLIEDRSSDCSVGIFNCGQAIDNGGFEVYSPLTGCPEEIVPINGGIFPACSWEGRPAFEGKPISSPDLFNSCASAGSDVDVSSNGFGFQAAHGGSGYAGLAVTEGMYQTIIANGGHLSAGKKYMFEMFVSLAEISLKASSVGFEMRDAGWNGLFAYNNPTPITNKSSWTRVSYCFTATGTESVVWISPSYTTVTPVSVADGPGTYAYSNVNFPNPNSCYYYIDDVSVKPIADAGSDQYVCSLTTSLGLTGCTGIAGSGYTWSKISGPGTATFSASSSLFTNVTVSAQGTYVFQLANNLSGCAASDQVTVTFTNPPTTTITPSTVTICSGQSTTLTASGALGYFWSNFSTASSITVSPGISTTYSVTGFNGVCSTTASVNVSVTPLPTAAISPASTGMCSGMSVTLTATGGTTYNWNNGLGAGAVKTVSPTVTTTYVITATSSGCSATASSVVNVNTSCCAGGVQTGIYGNNPLTFYDVSASQLTTIFLTSTITTAAQIAINGTLNVDADITFLNCPNVVFGPGAKTVIANNATLRINNSTFRACSNKLWKGIEAQFMGSSALGGTNKMSLIATNKAKIEDALMGVECWNLGRYDISATTFNKNYMGIFAHNISNSLSILTTSLFTCTSGILGSWVGSPIPVTAGINSYIGVDYNTNTSIQNCGDNANTFSGCSFTNLTCGIYGINSSFNVYYAYFSNISNFQPYQAAGWCINALDFPSHPGVKSNYTVTIKGKGWADTSPLVNNVRNGFHGENINFTILEYRMDNITLNPTSPPTNIAINTLGCVKDNIVIQNNGINNTYAGIKILNNVGSFQQVLNNHINVADVSNSSSPSAYLGIDAGFVNQSDNFLTQIDDNVISNGRFGIRASTMGAGSGVVSISGNFVSMPSLNTYNTGVDADTDPLNSTLFSKDLHGIYLKKCTGAGSLFNDPFLVEGNHVEGTGPVDRAYVTYRKCAITLEESPNLVVRCNSVNNTGIGLYTKGNSDFTKLNCNTFGYTNQGHQYCLLFRKTTVGGDGKIGQIGSASQCESNFFRPVTYPGGVHSYTSQNISTSPIFYDNSSNPLLDITSISGNTPPANYLQVIGASSFLTCDICGTGGSSLMAGGNGEESMLMDEESAESIIDGTIADIYDAPFEMAGTWLKERELYKQLDGNPEVTDSVNEYEVFYNEKKHTSVGQVEDLNTKIAFLSDTSHFADTLWFQEKTEEVLQDNAALPGNEVFESNEKRVNELYLTKVLTMDSIIPEDSTFITHLAYSCPVVEGSAVYKARAIYLTWNSAAIFDDEFYCQARTHKRKLTANKSGENLDYQFSLLPNPAKDFAKLNYHMPSNQDATVSLYNVLGELIIQKPISSNLQSAEINTSVLSQGLYYVKVQQGSAVLYSSKLSVIK